MSVIIRPADYQMVVSSTTRWESRQTTGDGIPVSGMAAPAVRRDDESVGVPPAYRGKFDVPQAERLLWRAGFGPRPREAEALAKLGLHGAVTSLVHPGRERARRPRAARLEGPAARARRRVGARPLLVARPHGAHLARRSSSG